MRNYAIENFLLDVYYPIDNDFVMEGSDGKVGIVDRIIKAMMRIIEFIRTNIIDRFRRFIKNLRNKAAATNKSEIMVTQEFVNLLTKASTYMKDCDSTISVVARMVGELYQAARNDQERSGERDNTETEKVSTALGNLFNKMHQMEIANKLKDEIDAAKNSLIKKDLSVKLNTSVFTSGLDMFDTVIKSCDELNRKLGEKLKMAKDLRNRFSNEEYAQLNVFKSVGTGLTYASKIVSMVSEILNLCGSVFKITII